METAEHITDSLSWAKTKTALEGQLHKIGHCPDGWRMLRNMDKMVAQLALAEIEERTGRTQGRKAREIRDKVNEQIDFMAQYFLLMLLSGGQ